MTRSNEPHFCVLAASLVLAQLLPAQEPASIKVRHRAIPWTERTMEEVMQQSATGATIPLFSYSFATTKDGTTRTGVMVGTSPFASTKTSSMIPTVVIPVKMIIGSAVLDPSLANTCDGGISPMNRFMASPLVQSAPIVVNGINVGTTQFVDGFRRAEFWSQIRGSDSYHNTLNPVAPTAEVSVTVPSGEGANYGTSCAHFSVVSDSWWSGYLTKTLIPKLTSAGVISPYKFAIFVLHNVATSASPGELTFGEHDVISSTLQTYAWFDWDTSGANPGFQDGVVASHEIAEWMDDPMAKNPVPNWGIDGNCQNNLEVGDPLQPKALPAITMNGKAYLMQEMAFFSWFFNKLGVPSLGAGGKFSSGGTFKGPAKVCPTGGSY